MLFTDAIRLALRAIVAQRLRSFLTLLGIAVGIASVILLTSIGEGIHRFVLAEFTQFGTNIASISPGKVKTSGPTPTGIPTSVRPLTLDDARALRNLPHVTGMTAHLIADELDNPRDAANIEAVRAKVHALTSRFPVYR